MKLTKNILIIICFLLGSILHGFGQNDRISDHSLNEKLEEIQLLTDTQQYSEAIKRLKKIEKSDELKNPSINQIFEFRMLMARVYRLSGEFDDAMREVDKIPNLDQHKKLKLKVDFSKSALYMENPKYSMEQRIKIVHPILDAGIETAKKLNIELDLAAFYNMKASLLLDECNMLKKNCTVNRKISTTYYKKSMELFLLNKDTANYHNVLNGLFQLSVANRSKDVDSLRDLVLLYASRSSFAPILLASRHRLARYYITIKNDSLNYFKQTILEKNAMIDLVNNNADNTIGKLKLLYEFDSLKSSVITSKALVEKQDVEISEKNKSIQQTYLFSITLAVFLFLVIYFLVIQRKLTKKMNIANLELQNSNNNYELVVRESNHRIKNNLQMILSMLELDKGNISNEGIDVLTNISAKISTITALHRILDFKEHNQRVLLKAYFEEIISYYTDLSKNKINFITDFANPEIKSERIIYFGLILNEMLSNTIKHRKNQEEVIIQVLKDEDKYIFIYRDNSNFKEFTRNSGINLIEGLIKHSGGINYVFNPTFGEYKFYFND